MNEGNLNKMESAINPQRVIRFKRIFQWKYLSSIGFVGFFGMLPYVWLLTHFGDPRVADGGLNNDEFWWYEKTAFIGGVGCLLISWARAVYEAFYLDMKGWFFCLLFFFPITPLYFWITDEIQFSNYGSDNL